MTLKFNSPKSVVNVSLEFSVLKELLAQVSLQTKKCKAWHDTVLHSPGQCHRQGAIHCTGLSTSQTTKFLWGVGSTLRQYSLFQRHNSHLKCDSSGCIRSMGLPG